VNNELKIGLVGPGKMGRIHSQAYLTVPRFFNHRTHPVLSAICGRNPDATAKAARDFGWANVETDWRRLIDRDDVDLVDICTPNDLHADIALAALAAGKHVVCEKPLAVDGPHARLMHDAARDAGVQHLIVFNYRFVPAVRLAKELIDAGELGEIYQYVGSFQQDWLSDPDVPVNWRLRSERAGSGVLGDLGAHTIDLARYLVGEVDSVMGVLHTSVPTRPDGSGDRVRVDVDDSFESLVQFGSGASGVVCASRVATGQKTRNRFEVYGSAGAVQFDFGSMNELRFFNTADDPRVRGFRSISTMHPGVHPWASNWWGQGHHIGFEHTFAHVVDEVLSGLEEDRPLSPNFGDGLACQQVMDAIIRSSRAGARETVAGG